MWRLAYDTAARADELLNLNVEDLDLQDRSAHELFEAATGGRWTLHQLRHTRLSHFGDDGADLLR